MWKKEKMIIRLCFYFSSQFFFFLSVNSFDTRMFDVIYICKMHFIVSIASRNQTNEILESLLIEMH